MAFTFDCGSLIGAKVAAGQLKAYGSLLNTCSQVLINCEHQINRYQNPYGTVLADIARKTKKSAEDLSLAETRPCFLLYNMGIEFSEADGQPVSAGLSLLCLKMADELMVSGDITFRSLVNALTASLEYTEQQGWKEKILIFGIKPFCQTLRRLFEAEHSMNFCLGEAASAAESAAMESNGSGVPDSGAHAVGVFTRAIHESIKASII